MISDFFGRLRRSGQPQPCTRISAHPQHENCPGLAHAQCGTEQWHGPHWTAGRQLCRGEGFGAICPHGVQVLDPCDECAAEQP
jgi:hypothetical protein